MEGQKSLMDSSKSGDAYYDPGTLKGERTFMDMKVGQLFEFPNTSLGIYRLKRVEKPPMFGGRKTGRLAGCFVFEPVTNPTSPIVRETGSGWVDDWKKRLAGTSCQ